MSRRLTLAHLSAIILSPPELIRLAARVGFDGVGLRLLRVTDNSPGYSLMDDPAMMRATLDALRDTATVVTDIEFLRMTPDFDPSGLETFLAAGQQLGARHLITAPYDPDLTRLADNLAILTDRATAFDLSPVLEFFPWTSVPDLVTVLQIADAAGSGVGILVDSLHFDRSGSTLEDLRAVPRERMPFAHLCDAPVHPPYRTDDLLLTARAERLPPGEGEIDLTGFLSALPDDLPLALEVPMRAHTDANGAEASLRRIHDATRRLLQSPLR